MQLFSFALNEMQNACELDIERKPVTGDLRVHGPQKPNFLVSDTLPETAPNHTSYSA